MTKTVSFVFVFFKDEKKTKGLIISWRIDNDIAESAERNKNKSFWGVDQT